MGANSNSRLFISLSDDLFFESPDYGDDALASQAPGSLSKPLKLCQIWTSREILLTKIWMTLFINVSRQNLETYFYSRPIFETINEKMSVFIS